MVVRINWEQPLAIVPIINDGNIYGTKKINFGCTFSSFDNEISHAEKGSDPFDPVATQYCELRDATICIEQPTIAALQCIKNQLLTRSGCIYANQSLWEVFEQFAGPEKCLKRNGKRIFGRALRTDGRHVRTPPQEPHSRIGKHPKKRSSLKRVHAPTRMCIGFECVTG